MTNAKIVHQINRQKVKDKLQIPIMAKLPFKPVSPNLENFLKKFLNPLKLRCAEKNRESFGE